MADSFSPALEAAIDRLLVELVAGINLQALYAADHPRLEQGISRVIAALQGSCDASGRGAIEILLIGDDLVVDERLRRKASLYQQHLAQTLRRRRVERLTIARELGPGECQQLLQALAGTGAFPSTPHVIVGQVEIALRDREGAADGSDKRKRPEVLTAEQLAGAKEAFVRFRVERRLALAPLEEIVWSLIDGLARSTREVLPLAPLKDYDEYTFIHSVNVSMLTLAQARAFGLAGPTLHSIGLAALLHDMGKLDIPLEILNKPGKLDEQEWTVMMAHAELGAWHLCGMETSAPLSILVAYEHHLRYDGRPNYPILSTPRRPTLASQMTSIADTYDAICTIRPYKEARPRQYALGFLRSRAGTFHDPLLVASFHRLVGEEPGPAPG